MTSSHTETLPSLMPRNLPEMIELAERVAKSTAVPESFRGKAGDCLVAMLMGAELGLKPLQALQSIAVINGRPCIWGDGARGLVMASGLVESVQETDPAEVARTQKARCEITRKHVTGTFIGEFGAQDAQRAGLNGKATYKAYPVQMYQWRAWHLAARKAFPDIYKGLGAAEEYQDVIDVTPQKPISMPAPAGLADTAAPIAPTGGTAPAAERNPVIPDDEPASAASPPPQVKTPEVVEPERPKVAGIGQAGVNALMDYARSLHLRGSRPLQILEQGDEPAFDGIQNPEDLSPDQAKFLRAILAREAQK